MTTVDVEREDATAAEADAAAEQARVVERRRKRWGCLLYAGLAFLIPTLVLFCTYLWFAIADRRLADEALARARAAGDPLTTAEMQALFYPPSPAIDEATEHWKRALELAKEAELKTVRPRAPIVGDNAEPELDENGLYSQATLKLVDEYLEGPGDDAIREAHEARKAGAVARFESDVPTDESTIDDDGPGFLTDVRDLLTLDMERAAARGDYDRAVEDLLSMIATSEAFADDPSPWGMDYHVAICKGNCRDARSLIDRVDLTDEELRRLDAAFAKQDFHRSHVRLLQADQYRVVRAYETDEPEDDEILSFARKLPLRGADEALAIELFQDALDEAKIDLAGAKKASDRLVARHEEFDRMSKLDSFRYGVAIYSSWETVRYYDCAFVADASQKLARAGIACERYRLKHGSWPEGLEALVPEYLSDVPIDVFAGSRFSYEVEGDRLSLESAQHAIRYAGTYQGASPLKFVLEKPSQR